MSQKESLDLKDEMRPEYDISGGVRGRFFKEYQAGTNVVVLDPDVAAVFENSKKVNRALRLLMEVANKEARSVGKKGRASNKGMRPPAHKTRRG